MRTYQNSITSEALAWWNELFKAEKGYYLDKWFPENESWDFVSNEQVVHIYKKEKED